MSPSKKSPRSSGNEPEGNKPHISEANGTNATATRCVNLQPSQPDDSNANTTGCGDEGGASGGLAGSEKTPDSPWYSPHTGRKSISHLTAWRQIEANIKKLPPKDPVVKIYPSGIIIETGKGGSNIPPNGFVRGAIEGFSYESARRLKKAFMTMHVPGFDLWAFTLTTHKSLTPGQWRSSSMRFRQAVKYAGWAGVWRVELQRRGTPHDHVAFWLPPGIAHDDVATRWLDSTGEIDDPEARQHAVHSQRIKQNESGWAIYMSLHNGKHKKAQLGWEGKQWGIWNRVAFTERSAESVPVPETLHFFRRILRNLENAQRRRHVRELCEKGMRLARAGYARAATEALQKSIALRKRPKIRPLHQGNLLRCMKGENASTILKAINDGRITTTKKDTAQNDNEIKTNRIL